MPLSTGDAGAERSRPDPSRRAGRICFYCGESVRPWGPGSLLRGIGGSEEATILLSRHLARLGWQVEVFGRPPTAGRDPHGVTWHPAEAFGDRPPGDVFVAWRSADWVPLGRGWSQVHHWLHDRQEWDYPSEMVDSVDRILVLSRTHAADPGLADVDPRKLHRTSNGLDPEFLAPPGGNEPHRAIYATCPARGLIPVLEMWPRVRRRVPHARLDVYYGFTEIYDDMARDLPGLRYIKAACLELMAQPGVVFHGMVGQHELAEAFARAGLWLYPTDTRETSCITAMKALAMGCFPVTSGLGVLAETLGGRDLGPVHATRPISRSRRRLRSFRRTVVREMLTEPTAPLRERRLEWARWARETYSWEALARDWTRLFAEVAREKGAPPPGPGAPGEGRYAPLRRAAAPSFSAALAAADGPVGENR